MKIKYLIIILGTAFYLNIYSQESKNELILPKYKIKNPFFKSILNNIISLEKKYESKNTIYNELYLIIIEKRNNKSFDIIIAKGNKNDISISPITMSSIGFLYYHKELFIIKGNFLPDLFKETKCKKKFKYSDYRYPIDEFFEWNYTFYNGYLFLKSGIIEN